MSDYHKEGYVAESIGALIILVLGVVIATVVTTFGGVLTGQVYQNVEADLTELNTTNATAYNYVQNGIIEGFSSLETTSGYLPIVVLAVIIFLVLGLVMSLGGGSLGSSRNQYGGGVL